MGRLLHRRGPSGSAASSPARRAQRDVFVSYAREDIAFVRRLHDRLREAGKTSYIDFSDIPQWSDDWQADLYTQIDSSDSVVLVLSPDSVASPNVARELERVVTQRKRLRPLLFRDVDADNVAPEIGRPQWIDFRDAEAFDERFGELLTVLDTDVEWVERHTRFLLAATDWQGRGEDRSLLLGRSDLREAEAWLARQAGKEPPPSELQVRYILESRRAAARRQRLTLTFVVAALVVTAVLAALALIQRGQAIEQRDQARSRELAALSAAQLESDPEQSLRLALSSAETARTGQAEAALQQALAASHVRSLLDTPPNDANPILDGAVTPDGRFAVTVHADRLGRVWDLGSGRLLATLRGHTAPVTSVDISSDGSRAVTASAYGSSKVSDGTARIWALPSGRLLERLRNDASGIGHAVFSPDGKRVVTTTDFDAFDPATVWDVRTGKRLVRLGADGEVQFATWSPDGKLLATIDGAITVWNAKSGRRVRSFRAGKDAFPVDLAFSPDGKRLAAAGDGVGFIASIAGGDVTPLPGDHSIFNALTAVRFCPDGSCVLTTSDDDTARIWSLSGRELATLRGHTANVTGASFSNDGRLVLTESEDTTARVWSSASGAQLAVLRGHDGDVTSAHFVGATDRVFTTSGDGTGRVWDPGVSVVDGRRNGDFVTDARFSPATGALATASLDGTARLWSATGALRHTLRPEDLSTVDDVVFSPDGSRLLVEQDSVSLWSSAGKLVRAFDNGIGYPAFSPDSALVAAADLDAVRLFDARNGRLVATLAVGSAHDRKTAVFTPAFSPDGRLVAAPGALTGAHVWNVRRPGRSVDLLTNESIDKVVFSPDGRRLLTAGDSARVVRIWDVEARKNVVLDRYPGGVRALGYSPDGSLIFAVSSGERGVRVYDAETRRRITVLHEENEVMDASFDPASRLLLTVGNDDSAHLWDARSGRLVATIGGHQKTLSAARFSPDGRTIVTASDDGTAVIHRCDECLAYDELVELARRRVAGSRP